MYGEMQHDIQLYLNQVKWAEQQKILHRVKRDGIPTDPKFREMWYLVRWVCFTIIIKFCLHYTTEHTQKLRHGHVGQPGPR